MVSKVSIIFSVKSKIDCPANVATFCTKCPDSSTKLSSIGSLYSWALIRWAGLNSGLILKIQLSVTVSIVDSPKIGIGLLIIGRIIFFPICFLYLLSFEWTITPTSEKKLIISSTITVSTSFLVSTKHLISSTTWGSVLRSISSVFTILWFEISR